MAAFFYVTQRITKRSRREGVILQNVNLQITMEQEINYGGHSTTPSDYVSKDGDLAVAVNLLNENGSVGVVLPPKVMRQLPSDTAAVYVHDTAKMKHYILVLANGDIYWADAEGLWGLNDTGYNIQGIEKVVPLGNTLCILSESGMDYLLWKDGEGEYKRLSPNLPEIKLSFGLQCEFKEEYIDENEYEAVLGKVNAFLNKEGTMKGRFFMPFLVRYAYRLFDSSTVMQSAPVLMIPTSSQPFVSMNPTTSAGSRFGEMFHPFCELDVQVNELPSNWGDYADIIRGVDIFVSAPIYTYNQEEIVELEEVSMNVSEFYETSYGIYKLKTLNKDPDLSHHYDWGDSGMEYSCYPTLDALTMNWSLAMTYMVVVYTNTCCKFAEPLYPIRDKIRDCGIFYQATTVTHRDLPSYTTRKVLDITGGVLSTLTARPTLEDDYDSHNSIKSVGALFSYNQRLLEGGIKKTIFNGYFNICHVESSHHIHINYSDQQIDIWSVPNFPVKYVATWMKKEGVEHCVIEELSTPIQLPYRIHDIETTMGSDLSYYRTSDWLPLYFYYPEADAYTVRFITENFPFTNNVTIEGEPFPNGGYFCYRLRFDLMPHDMLNGAYCYDRFWKTVDITVKHEDTPEYEPSADNTYEQPNKLYTSEVLNPWYFPVEGIVTVGNGEVKALAAATQALSQGQFGQFPLYAFCSDGVWALTVGQTGYFTSSHPVSRDVCTNPDGVTQIDSAVIYPTERGLMLLVGSTNKCFTDELYDKGETTIVNTLTGMDELLTKAELTRAVLPEVSFIEYMEGCKMVYDYVRQRITVYNPSRYPASPGQTVGERKYKYAYVYSLKTNKWGMVESNLEWTTNSYPEALAMTDDKKLVDVSGERGSSTKVKGLLVTRPLKLGDGDIYKSIHTMIQRGMFERGDVGCVLWGSRDLYHWYLVGSSKTHELRMLRGTGYKYYRIGLLVDLPESKSVSRATIELEGRMMNVVR